MTWVLVPEPAPRLAQLPMLLGGAQGVHVVAPWALPRAPWLPARLRRAWAQRTPAVPTGGRVWGLLGWMGVELAVRLRARLAAATFRARFALRRRGGQAAALLPWASNTVVASSLAAREVFARARARGARCVLVEDLPSLRELHADLDAAAAMHPEEAFLRNHRASAADVARQEAERVLADEVWVRSPLARARLLEAGHAPTLVRLLSQAPVARGIPIIATDRATGAHAVHRVPRGDVEALVEQLRLLDATHDRVHCP